MKRLQTFLVALSVFGMSVSAAHAASFKGVGFLDPNEAYSWARGVSADGNVVVGYSEAVGPAWDHAFRWVRGSGMSDLGDLDPNADRDSRAYDISADGNVVVGWSINSISKYEAFRWEDGAMFGLGSVGGTPNWPVISKAYGVSRDGNVIVGTTQIDHEDQEYWQDWFRWEDTQDPNDANMVRIGNADTMGRSDVMAHAVSDDGSVVVGHNDLVDLTHAYRWVQDSNDPISGTIYDLGAYAGAEDVSADGNVVVGWTGLPAWQLAEAFRWTAESGTMVGLGELPDNSNQNTAWGVSPDGDTIVGESALEDTNDHAFIWDVGSEKVFDLKKVLVEEYGLGDEHDLNNWVLTAAKGINSDGSVIAICGDGTDPNDVQQGWVAVITPLRTPDANDDSYTALKNRTMSITTPGVLSNDSDPDGHSLTATLLTDVTDGNLTLNANGGFEYTPNANWDGIDTFTYRAYDAPLCSKPANVTIEVVEGEFEGLGFLDANNKYTYAYGVSADGNIVVGKSRPGSTEWEAFSWEDGTMTRLGDLAQNGTQSCAYGASGDGDIVVGIGNNWDGDHAVKWQGGITLLGALTGEETAESWAYDASADGNVIVGASINLYSDTQAFRWAHGTMTGLAFLDANYPDSEARGVSSDGNVVVGKSKKAGSSYVAVMWKDSNVIDLGYLPGGAVYSWAHAVSADGNVVVGTADQGGGVPPWTAFRWTEDGNMQGVGVNPDTHMSEAYDVSGDGSVVVGYRLRLGDYEAFIWDADNGLRDVKDVLKDDYDLTADVNDWDLKFATGISDDGTVIVGYGSDPNGDTQAWRASIPKVD